MQDFEYLEATSVAEACALLNEAPEGSAVFAGGTDILVDLKAGSRSVRRLVSLQRIDSLRRLEIQSDGVLHIGAMVSVNHIARDDAIRADFPGITDAALSLAAEQVRNQATLVGNLCMAVPSADMAPILLAHGATLRIVSPTGERRLPVEALFVGPRRTSLAPDDVVVAVEIDPAAPGTGGAALRQGGRVSLSLPIVSSAAVVTVVDGICREATVALGAVAPTPMIAQAAGKILVGSCLGDDVLAEAGEIASTEARPIDDLRASREYRLELIRVITRRVIRQAADRALGEAG